MTSRLDMIHVSKGWWELWGESSHWGLLHDVFDHCLLVLMYSNKLWDPKPFKFNNHCHTYTGLNEIVLKMWSSSIYVG